MKVKFIFIRSIVLARTANVQRFQLDTSGNATLQEMSQLMEVFQMKD